MTIPDKDRCVVARFGPESWYDMWRYLTG